MDPVAQHEILLLEFRKRSVLLKGEDVEYVSLNHGPASPNQGVKLVPGGCW